MASEPQRGVEGMAKKEMAIFTGNKPSDCVLFAFFIRLLLPFGCLSQRLALPAVVLTFALYIQKSIWLSCHFGHQ